MKNEELLQNMKTEIDTLGYRNTPALREIAKRHFKFVSSKSSDEIFSLCKTLLESKNWCYQIIAYDWAFRLKKHYTINTFSIFENWLYTYIIDWYDCDDFCCHAFGYLIYKYPVLVDQVYDWTKSENFAVRRAAAVIFIYSIRKGQLINSITWKIVETLMYDQHYLVLKGYGWLLKEMTKDYKMDTVYFLQKYEAEMPRLSFRYAIEKLTVEEKNQYFKN